MPSPKGQITKLHELLRDAPMLAGYPDLRVLLGARQRTFDSAPPRIVLYPVNGKIVTPAHKDTALRDSNRSVFAQVWGKDFDQVEELQTMLVQALAYQAAGGYSYQSNLTAGQFWQAFDEEWDDHSDSNKQGEVVYMQLVARHSIDKAPQKFGEVDSISLSAKTPTLTATLAVDDVVASVDSTEGFASYGLIIAENEQIQYTGTTPTSFTGLVRGANFTMPASHAQGVTLKVL